MTSNAEHDNSFRRGWVTGAMAATRRMRAALEAAEAARGKVECDGARFIPVSVSALSFLRSPELIRAALGKLSPHMLGTLGFSADEAKAVESLWSVADSFSFDAAPSSAPAADERGWPGLSDLAYAIEQLREKGNYRDEEGEATDALEDLLNALKSSAAPARAQAGEAVAPFGWAILDKNGCTERVVSRVHYEFNSAEPVIRAGVAHDLLPYLDREYRGAAPHRIVTLHEAPPPADARDGARILLLQAIAAMSKLRQSLEFPGRHGGLYVFPEEAVRKFTDEQARLMYEEKQLAGGAEGGVTDSVRLEFVMRKFPGSAARDAGITWGENTIDGYRAAIDRAMGDGT
jgi:hypothetical protein